MNQNKNTIYSFFRSTILSPEQLANFNNHDFERKKNM